jgi:hypothetical protein
MNHPDPTHMNECAADLYIERIHTITLEEHTAQLESQFEAETDAIHSENKARP